MSSRSTSACRCTANGSSGKKLKLGKLKYSLPPTGLVSVEENDEREGVYTRPRSTSFTTGARPVGSGEID